MNHQQVNLQPGLYLVATPIGNARDITLRSLDILASADVIASEDTRTTRKLLDIHRVPLGNRPLIAYHDHSSDGARARIVENIAAGKSVAYVSEAGTPLISDPGFALGRDVIAQGGTVTAAPGASAVLGALTIAGLPTDRFLFLGFPPPGEAARLRLWAELGRVDATLVLYESPRRVAELMGELAQHLGGTRRAAVCRELTKKFEEVLRGTLDELHGQLTDRTIKGECVVLIDRPVADDISDADVETALREALKTMRVKDAATAVAGSFGLPRRDVYQIALGLDK